MFFVFIYRLIVILLRIFLGGYRAAILKQLWKSLCCLLGLFGIIEMLCYFARRLKRFFFLLKGF